MAPSVAIMDILLMKIVRFARSAMTLVLLYRGAVSLRLMPLSYRIRLLVCLHLSNYPRVVGGLFQISMSDTFIQSGLVITIVVGHH